MKRLLALLTTLIMVFSLFPVSALAQGETTESPDPSAVEETFTPEPTEASEATPTPVMETTPEPEATEAIVTDTPEPELIFFNLLGCDRLDSDGTGYRKLTCQIGEELSLKLQSESNALVSYRWQLLDATSSAEDPYVDIDTNENATAEDQTLVITPDEALFGVENSIRCVATATLGEQTQQAVCYYTLEKALPAPDIQEPSEIGSLSEDGRTYYATTEEGLDFALEQHYPVIFTDGSFSITKYTEIPSDVIFVVTNTNLTIESGVTLKNNSFFAVDRSGVINVYGTIENYSTVQSGFGATLNILSEGSYVKSSDQARLVLVDGGSSEGSASTINGVSKDQIVFECDIHSNADFSYAMNRSEEGYQAQTFFIRGATHLTENIEFPSSLSVNVIDTLTVDFGVTLTLNGTIEMQGGTLVNNGTIIVNGRLCGNGIFSNNGTMEGEGEQSVYTSASNETELRNALDFGSKFVSVNGDFQLTENLQIPEGTQLSIYHATLTVPNDIELINYGKISADESGAKLIIEGTLNNSSLVYSWDGGEITFQNGGTYMPVSEDAQLEMSDRDADAHSVISGVDASYLGYHSAISAMEDFGVAMSRSNPAYRYNSFHFENAFEFTADAEIPVGYTFWAPYDITVASGKTLTINGCLDTAENTTFTNYGTIIVEGILNIGGSFVNEGTISGNGKLNYNVSIHTEAELRAALEGGIDSLNIVGSFALTEDLAFQPDTHVNIEGATLTIPNGITLQSDAWMDIFSGGGIVIQNGGTLVSSTGIMVHDASFTVEPGGTYIDNNGNLYAQFALGASITGVHLNMIIMRIDAENEQDVRDALAFCGMGYRAIEIHQQKDITLQDDLTLPEDTWYFIDDGSGAQLKVPSEKTLTIDGSLNIGMDCELLIDEGATLANNGTLSINGTYTNNGNYVGEGEIVSGERSVTTWAELKSAVQANCSLILIDGDITIQEDLSLTSGMKFNMDTEPVASLIVPSGVTLTLDPESELYIGAGSLDVMSGATLVNNGWLNMGGGSFTLHEGATFYDNANVDIVENAVGTFNGTYMPGQDHWFTYTDTEGTAKLFGIDLKYVFYRANVSTVDDINTFMAKASEGYRFVDLYLNNDLTLPADFELIAGVYLEIGDTNTLTVSAGNTVTISGYLHVLPDATLEIQAGATINVTEDGNLNIEGTLICDGEINGNYDYTAYIQSDEDLRAAAANGAKNFRVVGSFTLEDDFTLPNGVMMSIDGATLTVPSGMTLTVYSFTEIRGGTLLIESGATLDNRDGIWIYNADEIGVLEIRDGAQYIAGPDSWVAIQYNCGEVRGLSMDKVGISVPVWTEDELKDALLLDLTGYREATVNIMAPITLNSNAKVPAGIALSVELDEEHAGMDGLTIGAGATLTNAGNLCVQQNNTLVVDGTLANVESGTLELVGTMINNGSVTYADDATVQRYVKTEQELIDAVGDNCSKVSYLGDITLTQDLTIPSTVILETGEGGALTIADNATLTLNQTRIWVYGGSLVVAEGGKLVLSDRSKVSLWGSGTLEVNGEMQLLGDGSKIYLREDDTASISGISEENCKHVYAYKNVFSQDEMIYALNYYKDSPYADNVVYPCVDIACTEDITVPNRVNLIICDGVTFTVPEEKTLTIADGGALHVDYSGTMLVAGTLENYGTVEFAAENVTITGTFNDHSGETSYIMQATTLAELKTMLASTQRPLTILCSGFTINSNITIPSGIDVNFDLETTSAIEKGYTVTVDGILTIVGTMTNKGTLIVNGEFAVGRDGTLINAGSWTNNGTTEVYGSVVNDATVTGSGTSRVRFLSGSLLDGTNTDGSWYITEGTLVSELAINGVDTIGIGETFAKTYSATTLPSNAWNTDVTWSITDGAEFASIDETTGELQGLAEGTVTICATATDGSDVTAEKTVSVVDYSIAISGQDWVLAGKSLQLTGEFVPANPTGTSVLWSLAEGDTAYASINSTGLLTAKPVTELHEVTVTASPADGQTNAAEKQITIYPLVSALKIMKEETDVTGQTLTLNSNTSETLALSGALYPTDAKAGITWSLSAADAVTMEPTDDGASVTLTPIAGKTKLVTLTAKADNGSSILATVKVQVTAQSTGVTVSGVAGDKLMAGKSAQLTATFTDPQPVNRAVKWVLAPEYEAYATLSSTGLLTAKAVTDAVTIKIYAIPLDGGPSSEAYAVTLQPLAAAVVIKWGPDYVTGTTLTLDMARESSLALTAQTWPDAAEDEVTWSSSAPTIASVDDEGNITALAVGTVTITVRAEDGSGKTAFVKVTIKSLPQSIKANAPVLSLRGGVGATYSAINTTDSASAVLPATMIRWSLIEGNASYASITTAGVLKTTVVPCEQTIKLRAEVIGNETVAYDEFEVKIYPAVQSLAIQSEGNIVSGKTLLINAAKGAEKTDPESITLNALILPLDSQQGVVWTSSNTKIAQVTNGVVTPVQSGGVYTKGLATITAKATDGSGKSATVTIQVVEGVQSISFNVTEGATLQSKKTLQLYATADNATATNKKINMSVVEGGEYVSLSSGGLLTAKTVYEDKTVVIEANSADGCATKRLTLTILAQDNPIQIYNWDESENYSGMWKMIDANSTDYSSLSDIKLQLLAKEESVSGKAISWSVSPSTVAKVVTTPSGLLLQALTTGVATVTAKTADGRSASFTVEIYRGATALTIAPPKGMDAENLTLASGKAMQLSSAFAPKTGITTKGVVWTLVEEGASLKTPVLANDYATISTSGLFTARTNLTEPVDITVRAYSANAPYLTSNDMVIHLLPIVTGLEIVRGDSILTNTTFKLNLSDRTVQLEAVAYPENASQGVTWSSSSNSIATVSSTGLVTAVKSGTVTITAKASDGSAKSATMKLTVAALVDTIEITSAKGFEVRGGATLQLGIAFTPTAPTDKRVTWSLEPEDALLAKVSSTGLITTKTLTHAATIHVTATSLDNPSATSTKEITICPATTKVLILDALENDVTGKTLMLDLNGTEAMQLSAQNLPTSEGGAIQGVTWKSSNTSVLKVTDGTLVPVTNTKTGKYNTGTVTITATATDGSGKTATMKVNARYLVSGISFASDLTVKAGMTLTLKPIIEPLNATSKTVKWSIAASDIAYATISSTGVLTAKKVTSEKTITIICAAQDGSGVTQEVTVTILP